MNAESTGRQEPSACYRKAIDLLSRREHFRQELQRKLAARHFAAAEVDETLAKLQTENLVDDRRAARGLALGAFRRKGFGPRRMRAELLRRGVAAEIVEAAIAEAFDSGEEGPALEAAERWLRTRRANRQANRQALARHLERKGFNQGTVISLLERLELENEGDREGRGEE